MRLTSFTDCGLRALMRMAGAQGRAFSIADLATEFGQSRNHLARIMQRLAREGLAATRGGGGAAPAGRPEAIRIGAVVRLLKEGQPLVGHLGADGGACIIHGRRRLKARLRSAEVACPADLDSAALANVALAPA